jgi:hypothetical protein
VWTDTGVTGGAATPLLAGPDADSSGAVVVTGSADLWIKTTVGSETDAVKIERVTLLGGGAVSPVGPLPQVLSVQGRTGAVVLTNTDVGAASPTDLSTGLATKVNTSTYTAGLAAKQDTATLGATVAADATVRATLVPRAADGFANPKTLPLPPQPLRLGAYRTANSRPTMTATNQPEPSSNYTEYSFATGAPSNFTYWGSTTWQTNTYSVAGSFGAANPGGIYAPPWNLEFVTDSPTFALKLSTGNSYFQVLCDEEIIYEASTPPTGGSWIQFTWSGARRMRRYRLFGAMGVQTLRCATSDTVFAPKPPGPLVAWVTDSYGQVGGRTPHTLDGYVRMASAMLGWRYAQNTDGGTGYGQAGTAGTLTFLQRVPQVIACNPDAVVWAGGHNMSSTEMANGFTGLRASAAAVFAAGRASLPTTPMWALGPLSQSTTFQTNNNAAWDQLALACADYNVTFIDTRGWITGNGYEGSRTVSDAATTASSTTITSATANFVSGDVGAFITGGSIPSNATIASVSSTTTATLSAAASASATGVSVTIANQHGDGNADVLVSADGTHYNAYGAEYVAVRMYEAIRATLGGN